MLSESRYYFSAVRLKKWVGGTVSPTLKSGGSRTPVRWPYPPEVTPGAPI